MNWSKSVGISPDYTMHVGDSVLATFDGPTLQHSIKEMNGETLRQIPKEAASKPDRELLAERYDKFLSASQPGVLLCATLRTCLG